MMAEIFTLTTVVSLAATAIFAISSMAIGFRLGRKFPRVEQWVLAWLVFDALVNFTLEGSIVYFYLVETVAKSSNVAAELWNEYGKADSWLHSDPTIASLEILTVVIDGTLCLVLIYAIVARRFYRHYVQLVMCVCELYGGWMTFYPEWTTGNKALMTDHFLYLWAYFFNMLWVVIPVALMYQSWMDIRDKGIAPDNQTPAPHIFQMEEDSAESGDTEDSNPSQPPPVPAPRYKLRARKDQ